MPQHPKHLYEFGPYRLDPAERRVLREGKSLPLPPKVFETLLVLVENAGHALEKDELLRRIWGDTFVEEVTLAKNISLIRKALGEGEDEQRYIETVSKYGYRFVAPVKRLDLETGELAAGESGRKVWLGAALLAVTALGLTIAWWVRGSRGERAVVPGGKVTIAVLPFQNLSPDPQQEYFSDGLTEEMIQQLSQLNPERLSVIARTSAMHYRKTSKSVEQIGRELGADYILEGSVRRSGDRVRISAQLIQVKDQTHLLAEDYDRDLRDVLALQSEVAQAIARQIEIKLTPQQQARLARRRPLNPEAYRLYLQGRYFWNQRTETGFARAVEYFQQAIEKQPDYAEAYAGLADCYALLGALVDAQGARAEAISRARTAALKALEIDGTLAEAHTSLAFVKWQYDWDWPGAGKEFQRALELNPGYATAHHWYAYLLMTQGQKEEGLREIRLAQESDPLSLIINTDFGELLCYAGQYDEAIRQSKKTLEMDPNFSLARRVLAWTYARKGMHAESIAELQKAVAVSGGREDLLMSLAYSYAMAGKRAEARAALGQMKRLYGASRDINFAMGVAYAAVGEKDQAFASLEKAYQARASSMILLGVAPVLDPLRSDPRFQDLLRRVGLPPENRKTPAATTN